VGSVSAVRYGASAAVCHDLCSIENELGAEFEGDYAARNLQCLPN
jgi:hypothetical protein